MIFKDKRPNRAKLLSNGFSVDGEAFTRREAFPNGFTLTITIEGGEVTTHLIDARPAHEAHAHPDACRGRFFIKEVTP